MSLSSELVATYDYDTEYEDDDTLEKGEEEVSVTGITGTKYQTYRTVYDGNGEVISSEPESVSVYDKRDKVVLRGTKEKEDTSEENSTEEKKTEEKTTEEKTTEDTDNRTQIIILIINCQLVEPGNQKVGLSCCLSNRNRCSV